ncbi:MAG: GGDEF domain-containing protein [Deltaproteobacteria bacterium]|nr:GGDEF domain-containing protein [Deltaproteobacteria bacterium]
MGGTRKSRIPAGPGRKKKVANPSTVKVRDSRVDAALASTQQTRPLLFVLDGPRLGDRIPLSGTRILLGRSEECPICLPDESISSRHLEIIAEPNDRFRVRDLGSLNGTLVNGERITQCVLAPGDRLVVGHTPLRFVAQTAAEEDLLQYLETCAVQDPLTRLPNRRYFGLRLDEEISFALRHAVPLSLLMMDLDRFKAVNDGYGHPVGDRLLAAVGGFLRGCVRTSDVVARIGGEEFAAILRQTGPEGARVLAERIRLGLERLPFTQKGKRIPIRISIGIASVPGGASLSAAKLLESADSRLYCAKQRGRNRVCDGAG